MATVYDIYRAIDGIAPFALTDEGDNTGLLVGDRDALVTKALLTMDITTAVVAEAVAGGAQLIISHHPVIFHPLYSILPQSPVYEMIANGVAALCAHTNLDMARGGISDIMVELLGFAPKEILELKHKAFALDGEAYGYGKVCELTQPLSPLQLVQRVRTAFGNSVVRYVEGSRPIRRVGVCSGAGGGNTQLAVTMGLDAYITGDIKHDQLITASNAGLTLVDAGHFHTEVVFAPVLQWKLAAAFPEVEFLVANSNIDPVKYLT